MSYPAADPDRMAIATYWIGAGRSMRVAAAHAGLARSTVANVVRRLGLERIAPENQRTVARIIYLGETADKALIAAAIARNTTPEGVAETLVMVAGKDWLFDAFLDDGVTTPLVDA